LAVAQHLPQGRCQAGDRHLKFHEDRDNFHYGSLHATLVPRDKVNEGQHDQLDVSEDVFWACVNDGIKPDRGRAPELPAGALPADMVYLLIKRVGLDEATVAAMGKDEAVTRLQQYWTEGH